MLLGEDLVALGQVVEGAGDGLQQQGPFARLQHRQDSSAAPPPLPPFVANPAVLGVLLNVLTVLLDGGLAALGQIVGGAGDLVLQPFGLLGVQLGELGGGGLGQAGSSAAPPPPPRLGAARTLGCLRGLHSQEDSQECTYAPTDKSVTTLEKTGLNNSK